jgi:AcrR family transcriptional regulator
VTVPPVRRGPGRPGWDAASLLAVAVQVFNERGYDGTSMEDLAKRLGISKSAIYHHVESKETLLSMALERATEGLFVVAGQVCGLEAPAITRLEALVHDSVIVLVEELPYVTLLLRVRGNTAVERRALARRRQLDRLAAELVEAAIAEGDIRADIDPHLAARLLFGLINSLVEWYRPRLGGSPAQLADSLTAIAFDGLRA